MELREIIKKNGMKQSWIAERLGISVSYLSLILNGKRRLTEEMKNDFSQLIERINGDQR